MRDAEPYEPVNLSGDERRDAGRRLQTYTASELRTMELPAVVWIVEQVISVGLWVLAGPPKVGKSCLVLDLLVALAHGGLALGSITVDKMEVLYLALEDNGGAFALG